MRKERAWHLEKGRGLIAGWRTGWRETKEELALKRRERIDGNRGGREKGAWPRLPGIREASPSRGGVRGDSASAWQPPRMATGWEGRGEGDKGRYPWKEWGSG